jgi:hypothetical protein
MCKQFGRNTKSSRRLHTSRAAGQFSAAMTKRKQLARAGELQYVPEKGSLALRGCVCNACGHLIEARGRHTLSVLYVNSLTHFTWAAGEKYARSIPRRAITFQVCNPSNRTTRVRTRQTRNLLFKPILSEHPSAS